MYYLHYASAFYFDNMQPLTVLVVFVASTAFGLRLAETTTSNDLDNTVFPTETSTNLPHPEHLPATGCFSHIPTTQDVDQTNNNMVPSTPFPQYLSDPVPTQYTPYPPPKPFGGPVVPGYNPSFPNYTPGSYPVRPTPFIPHQRFPFLPQHMNGRNIVIVKLLQPIILPVAKPFTRCGNEGNDNNEVDNERYMNGGFQHRNVFNRKFGGYNNEVEFNRLTNNMIQRRFGINQFGGRRFGGGNEMESGGYQRFGGNRRFGAESFNRPTSYRQNTFGPFKVGGGEENIQVTIKLH